MADAFQEPWDRREAILMDIRDGKTTDLGAPWTREEALLMQIRDNGGPSGEIPVASTTRLGGVKVDGETISIDSGGVIRVALQNADAQEF